MGLKICIHWPTVMLIKLCCLHHAPILHFYFVFPVLVQLSMSWSLVLFCHMQCIVGIYSWVIPADVDIVGKILISTTQNQAKIVCIILGIYCNVLVVLLGYVCLLQGCHVLWNCKHFRICLLISQNNYWNLCNFGPKLLKFCQCITEVSFHGMTACY